MNFITALLAGSVAASAMPARHSGAGCRATYYGSEMHGRTASGAPWRPNGLSLASNRFPLGTRVMVCHRDHCSPAIVNDRHGSRRICADLSQGLARKIGMGGTGIVTVGRL